MLHAHTNAAIQADRDRGLLRVIACAFVAVHRDRCLLVWSAASWSNGLGPGLAVTRPRSSAFHIAADENGS
jgi:hypothetical protein